LLADHAPTNRNTDLAFFADEILQQHEHELRRAILPLVLHRVRFKTLNREWGLEDSFQEAWLRALSGRLPALPRLAESLHREFDRIVRERGESEGHAALSQVIASWQSDSPFSRCTGELVKYMAEVVAKLASTTRRTDHRRATKWTRDSGRVLVYSVTGAQAVGLGENFYLPHSTELMALAKARLERSTSLYLSRKVRIAPGARSYILAFVQHVLLDGESLDNAMELLEPQFGPPPCSRMSLYRHATGIRTLMNAAA
jgi:hypothetical protein